jgi:hypothetical protein
LPVLPKIKGGKFSLISFLFLQGREILVDNAVGKNLYGMMLKVVMNTFLN